MMDAVVKEPTQLADDWLLQLETALSHPSSDHLEDLFLSDCYWRDALALTWGLETYMGSEIVADRLGNCAKAAAITSTSAARRC